MIERKAMAQWAESSRKAGNVTFTACSIDGRPINIRLHNARIPFEPSCYQADGTETRLNICFADASEDTRTPLAEIEQSIDAASSCIKGELVRCKIDMNKVRCYDANKKRIETPTMKGWLVNAQLRLNGKWATRQGTGLSLEATDIQFVEEAREPPCPF